MNYDELKIKTASSIEEAAELLDKGNRAVRITINNQSLIVMKEHNYKPEDENIIY